MKSDSPGDNEWTHRDNPPSISMDIKTAASLTMSKHYAGRKKTRWERKRSQRRGNITIHCDQFTTANLQSHSQQSHTKAGNVQRLIVVVIDWKMFFCCRISSSLGRSIRLALSREQKICKWCCFDWYCYSNDVGLESDEEWKISTRKSFHAKARINNLFELNWIVWIFSWLVCCCLVFFFVELRVARRERKIERELIAK